MLEGGTTRVAFRSTDPETPTRFLNTYLMNQYYTGDETGVVVLWDVDRGSGTWVPSEVIPGLEGGISLTVSPDGTCGTKFPLPAEGLEVRLAR